MLQSEKVDDGEAERERKGVEDASRRLASDPSLWQLLRKKRGEAWRAVKHGEMECGGGAGKRIMDWQPGSCADFNLVNAVKLFFTTQLKFL